MNSTSIVLGSALLLLGACSASEPVTEQVPRSVETFLVGPNAEASEPVYSGLLRARDRSDLSFLRSGQVIELRKELGDSFTRGETLARLDNTEVSLAVDELTANLRGAEADLADAMLNHDRLLALEGTGAVSGAGIDAAKARLDAAKARVSGIEASIGQARKRLSETVLKAPFDGQIVERVIEPSQTASAGQPVYRVIGMEGGLEAVVNLPVAALDLFTVGHETRLLVRPSADERMAVVTEVGNAAGRSGLYPVTLAIADSEGLRSGQRVEVPGQRDDGSSNGPQIPLTAYRTGLDSAAEVFILDQASGRLTSRQVELGAISDEGIEVISGLSNGDLIVARGLASLRDGDVVTPLGVGVRRFNE